MNELAEPVDSARWEADDSADSRRKRFQFRISSVLLLLTAMSVWLTFEMSRRERIAIERQMPVLKNLDRQLIIDDPLQAYVVRKHQRWADSMEWRIYLPDRHRYRLCLATEGIGLDNLNPLHEAVDMPGGISDVELLDVEREDGEAGLQIMINGELAFEKTFPAGWDPGAGSSSQNPINWSTEFDADEPIVLLRRLFMESIPGGGGQSSDGPTTGTLIWIEPMKAATTD